MSSIRFAPGIALLAAAALAGCGADESGNFREGKNDPALKTTEKDIAQVGQVLDQQDAKDKAQGLRAAKPAEPVNPHAGMDLPAGHPPVGEAQGPYVKPSAPKSDAAPAAAAPAAAGGAITFGALKAKLPEGWRAEPPASPMRLAQVRIPASAGDAEDGVIAISMAGGGLEANLQRWYGQVSQPDGGDSSKAAHLESFKVGANNVTLVDVAGSINTSMPGGPQQPPKSAFRLIGGIMETPEGLVFLKGVGPAKTMGDNRDKFVEFLKSITE